MLSIKAHVLILCILTFLRHSILSLLLYYFKNSNVREYQIPFFYGSQTFYPIDHLLLRLTLRSLQTSLFSAEPHKVPFSDRCCLSSLSMISLIIAELPMLLSKCMPMMLRPL